MKTKPLLSAFLHTAALISGIALTTPSIQAAIIASDSFSLNSTTRQAEQSLNGVGTEGGIGGLAWTSSPNFIFRQDARSADPLEGIASTTGSATIGFGLDFNFGDYSAHGSIATISFSSFYRKTGSGYLAFGFGSNKTTLNSTNGAIFVVADPTAGTWTLRSNASSTALASGSIPGTTGGNAWISYSLTYDNATQTILDLGINGESVLSNHTVVGTVGTISAATIMAQQPFVSDTGNGFDNFSLTVIPEPSSAALAGGACGLALAALSRKRR